eukprot:SAG11_NODE_18748_length_482_cov_1.039164_1_plen_32_part_01
MLYFSVIVQYMTPLEMCIDPLVLDKFIYRGPF